MEALQDQLPDTRVLYSSATGASEPDNLRYMCAQWLQAVCLGLASRASHACVVHAVGLSCRVRLGSFGYPSIGKCVDVLKK